METSLDSGPERWGGAEDGRSKLELSHVQRHGGMRMPSI